YFGEPLVYSCKNKEVSEKLINNKEIQDNSEEADPWELLNHYSTLFTKLLDCNVDRHSFLHENDVIILFPIAEITHDSNIDESAKIILDSSETLISAELINTYGQFIAKRFLVGGKLTIRNYLNMTDRKRNLLKSHIVWAIEAVTMLKENIFQNISFPNIEYEKEKFLNDPVELMNWMRKIYDDKEAKLISYEQIIPISYQRNQGSLPFFKRLIPGTSFTKMATLNEWVRDAASINLITWIKKFRLNFGMKINLNTLTSGENVAISFKYEPELLLRDQVYVNIIRSNDEFLLRNNILCSFESISSVPFLNESISNEGFFDKEFLHYIFRGEEVELKPSKFTDKVQEFSNEEFLDKEFVHYIIRGEKVELYLNRKFIKPTTNFTNMVQEALDMLKPYQALKKVFEDFVQNIFPHDHKLLKRIIDDLKDDDIFLDSDGHTMQKDNLEDWIKNPVDFSKYEIIGMDEFIPLYKILEFEQRREIELRQLTIDNQ
ncbi:2645_t:CDS:2, partial [Acaulospora colombiana]